MRLTKTAIARVAAICAIAAAPALFAGSAHAASAPGAVRPMTNLGIAVYKGTVLYAGDSIQAYIQYDDGALDQLIMQSDGNLVYYNYYGDSTRVCWASNTSGHPGAYAEWASNGYLYVYSETGVPLYAVNGNPGTTLSINTTYGSLYAGDHELVGQC